MPHRSLLLAILAFAATPALAAPNDARSGVPTETGTSVDILMDSTVTHQGAPKDEGDQPPITTKKTKVKSKKKALAVPPALETGPAPEKAQQ